MPHLAEVSRNDLHMQNSKFRFWGLLVVPCSLGYWQAYSLQHNIFATAKMLLAENGWKQEVLFPAANRFHKAWYTIQHNKPAWFWSILIVLSCIRCKVFLWICSASFCAWQLEDVVGQEAPAHCVMAFGLRTLVVVAATWLKWMLFMTTRIADIASAAVETMQPVFPIYVQRTWILFWLIKWISGNIILLESDEENSGIIFAIKSVHHWGQL